MTKIFCDNCGAETNIGKTIMADLDKDTLVYINIEPTRLNTTKQEFINPDLCAECIIKAIQQR